MSIDKIKERMRMIEVNDFTTSGDTNEIVLTAAALAAKAWLTHKAIKKAKKIHSDNVNSLGKK